MSAATRDRDNGVGSGWFTKSLDSFTEYSAVLLLSISYLLACGDHNYCVLWLTLSSIINMINLVIVIAICLLLLIITHVIIMCIILPGSPRRSSAPWSTRRSETERARPPLQT